MPQERGASSDPQLVAFERERARLVRLGYRMLGSLSEAEDIVQDAWLHWAGVEEPVKTPAAYLARIVTRLCLDRMKSARARRERYVGPWLPEPLLASDDADAPHPDEVTLTLMLALERLSPLERAAFLLHDVFDVAWPEVAEALGREQAAVRQLASRARKHVQHARPRYRVSREQADALVRAFFEAAQGGDTARLSTLLAADVEIHSDGGGKVLALRKVVRGLERALRLFAGLARRPGSAPVLRRTVLIDGLPGYVSVDGGGALQTTALDVRDGLIRAIYIVRNPDKLVHLAEARCADPRTGGEP